MRRSNDAAVTKGGDDGTVPIPEPLRPYLDAAIKMSPSKWVLPAADGKQRAPDTNLKAVLRRALGRAGIVEGYEHRCRKPGCGHVERADDNGNRRQRVQNVVPTSERQSCLLTITVYNKVKFRTFPATQFDVLGAHIGRGLKTVHDDLAMKVAAKLDFRSARRARAGAGRSAP